MPISIVNGASPGVGKGIVEGLSEAGHTTYFTGRNSETPTQTTAAANSLGVADIDGKKNQTTNPKRILV